MFRPGKMGDQHGMREGFAEILAGYVQARKAEALGGHPLRSAFKRIATRIQALPCTKGLNVKFSLGQGNWATIPWIALLDPEVTDRVSRGVYVIYLFQADMNGVYLTLNQGTSELGSGSYAENEYRARAAKLRKRCGDLSAAGFALNHEIDFRSDGAVARGYVHATVAHKYYSAAKLPSDAQIAADLDVICGVYRGVRGVLG